MPPVKEKKTTDDAMLRRLEQLGPPQESVDISAPTNDEQMLQRLEQLSAPPQETAHERVLRLANEIQEKIPSAIQPTTPSPWQALGGVFRGEQRMPFQEPEEPLSSTTTFEEMIREQPGIRGMAGQLTLPTAVGLLVGMPAFTNLFRGGMTMAEYTRLLLSEPLALAAVEAAQQVLGHHEGGLDDIVMVGGAPIALRGVLSSLGRNIHRWARISRAGKIAQQEAVQTQRTRLTRDYEQAVQRQREALEPIETMSEELQAQYKRAQQVQNQLRKAMQDQQRRLNIRAQSARTQHPLQARQLIAEIDTPTSGEIEELYRQVDSFDIELPAHRFRMAQDQLRQSEQLLRDFPGLQSGPIRQLAGETAEEISEPARQIIVRLDRQGRPVFAGQEAGPETFSFTQIQAALKRLGQRYASLQKSDFPQKREQLAAITTLRRSLEKTLDDAAETSGIGREAQNALQLANAAYKRFRTVGDLGELVEGAIQTAPDGTQALNAGRLLDILRTGRQHENLRKQLDSMKLLEPLRANLARMAQEATRPPPLTLPRAPMQPGRDILGKARQQLPEIKSPDLPRLPFDEPLTRPSLTGITVRGTATGGTALALDVDPQMAGAVSLAAMAPAIISRALMTPSGQRLLLGIIRTRGPQLDDTVLRLLAVAGGQTLRNIE